MSYVCKRDSEQEGRDGAETKETELRRAAETAEGAKDRESGGGRIVPGALLKRPRRKKTTAVCATTLKQTSSEVYNWRYLYHTERVNYHSIFCKVFLYNM